MQRLDVIAAIDTEREYQQKWARADDQNNVGDFLLYMQRELTKGVTLYVSPADPIDPAMAAIRKAVAIGVAAMEKFGTGTPRT